MSSPEKGAVAKGALVSITVMAVPTASDPETDASSERLGVAEAFVQRLI
jgi:hypothetical protein